MKDGPTANLLLRPKPKETSTGDSLHGTNNMKLTIAALLGLILSASTFAGATPAEDWSAVKARHQAAREAFEKKVGNLSAKRVFYLDPSATYDRKWPKSRRFHGWVVASSASPINRSSGNALARSFHKVFDSPRDGIDACFDPHHGVKLTDGVDEFDVVLCFKCSRYIIYDKNGEYVFSDSFAARPEEVRWDQVFLESGLKRPERLGGR